jgi:hypothetical protein
VDKGTEDEFVARFKFFGFEFIEVVKLVFSGALEVGGDLGEGVSGHGEMEEGRV